MVLGLMSASARAMSLAQMGGEGIEAREFHISQARVPGNLSTRQNVTVWQVGTGSWNGQVLDGLSIVLVQTVTEDGSRAKQLNCYVSSEATLEQRKALVGAFAAARPTLMSQGDAEGMRLESAVITVAVEGGVVVVHLGLVA